MEGSGAWIVGKWPIDGNLHTKEGYGKEDRLGKYHRVQFLQGELKTEISFIKR